MARTPRRMRWGIWAGSGLIALALVLASAWLGVMGGLRVAGRPSDWAFDSGVERSA